MQLRFSLAILIFLFHSAFADAGQLGRTTSEVNFREGPSRRAAVIDVLPAGTEVQVIRRNRPGWYFVMHGRQPGYVHENYVRIEQSRNAHEPKPIAGVGVDLSVKELGVATTIVIFLTLFLIVRRYVSFPKLTTVLIVCAVAILVLDTAFKLGILYSVLFVSLGLFALNAFFSRRGRMPPGI
jgi:hypothetical protein